jgi:hypothetical protein
MRNLFIQVIIKNLKIKKYLNIWGLTQTFLIHYKNGISLLLRKVVKEDNVAAGIHDKWILSKNSNYNIPSPDIVARGQYSEVKKLRTIYHFLI